MLMFLAEVTHQSHQEGFPWGMQAVVSIPLPLLCVAAMGVRGGGGGGGEVSSREGGSLIHLSRSWQSSSPYQQQIQELKVQHSLCDSSGSMT